MNTRNSSDAVVPGNSDDSILAEKQRIWAQHAEMLTKDQIPLVAALTAAGWPPTIRQRNDTRSVWDLVNTTESYPTLLDTLADHLSHAYLPRIREGIVRALAVKEARGTRIPQIIVNELKKETNPDDGPNSLRWVMIRTLIFIGNRELKAEVEELLKDVRYSRVKSDLMRLYKKTAR